MLYHDGQANGDASDYNIDFVKKPGEDEVKISKPE